MLYKKNVPGWERLARIAAAAMMAGCAVYFGATTVGWFFAALSATALITGMVGYCPACAISGRRGSEQV